MNDALVIVPTYNERDSLPPLTQAVLGARAGVDLLFVDDDSPDGTGRVADALAREDSRVHVLHHGRKAGLGRAYIAGFRWALERTYAYILEMDADFSHNPADLPRLLDAAEHADLVLGSRYLGGIRVINWPLHRLILSRGAATYVKWITGMPYTDPTGGFKCYRRAVLEEIPISRIASNGYSFQVETTHQAWRRGFRIMEVPITFEERRSGQSKMHGGIVREALWMVWKLLFEVRGRRTPPAPHPRSMAS